MKESKLAKQEENFYSALKALQRYMHLVYYIQDATKRLKAINAAPITKQFTKKKKIKLVKSILKELEEIVKEKK